MLVPLPRYVGGSGQILCTYLTERSPTEMASSSCRKPFMATENDFVAMVITLNLLTRHLHRNNEDPRYIPEAQL